jgi:hypothetical protein
MSDEDTAAIERRPLWTYYKTPAAVTAVLAAIAAKQPDLAPSLLPAWLVVLIAWTVWSLVSGVYPWSMGWGL